jgi:hypothetical protein
MFWCCGSGCLATLQQQQRQLSWLRQETWDQQQQQEEEGVPCVLRMQIRQAGQWG